MIYFFIILSVLVLSVLIYKNQSKKEISNMKTYDFPEEPIEEFHAEPEQPKQKKDKQPKKMSAKSKK